MIAAGQVIHSDPTVWDHRAGAEPAARQLLNAYFSVPQVSMDLTSLPPVQRDAVQTVLENWMEDREAVLFGRLSAGLPSEGYPVVQARHEQRLVVGVYQPLVVEIDLDGVDEVRLLNATSRERIVVRWTGKPRRLSGIAHSARGDVGLPLEVETEGLTELSIPVSGIATLKVLNE
jgi:alpha-galactosidase